MKILRITGHALYLTLVNFFGIGFGFSVYYLLRDLRPVNQIAIQVPLAGIASLLAFGFWGFLFRRYPRLRPYWLQNAAEYAWTYLISLVLTLIIFTPSHFIMRGYLTSFDNILHTWYFQIIVNLLTILLTYRLVRPEEQFTETAS